MDEFEPERPAAPVALKQPATTIEPALPPPPAPPPPPPLTSSTAPPSGYTGGLGLIKPVAQSQPRPTPDWIKPLPPPAPPKPAVKVAKLKVNREWPHVHPSAVVAALLVVTAIGTGIWVFTSDRVDAQPAGLTVAPEAGAVQPTGPVTVLPIPGTANASNNAGLSKSRAGNRPAKANPSTDLPVTIPAAFSVPATFGSGNSTLGLSGPGPASGALTPPSSPTGFEAIVSPATYDARDVDVQPPVIASPNVPAPRRVAAGREGAPAIEVVINEHGTVESARANVSPRTIGEATIVMSQLSAVKTWHFRPALKDGRPVKYRLMVPLAID
jgi:hypothetical protein